MRTYALVNQKGGVGKTTTAISLGAALANRGEKVLIVDGDPQANATSCLGIEIADVTAGLYDAMIERVSASECVLRNPKLKLTLLPSSPALAGAQVELVGQSKREYAISRALEPLDGHFDYVFIDCPPSLGLLTVNGLVAAVSGVIIPVQCEYLALEGLSQLMHTLERVRSGLFPTLAVRGLVLTMYDGRTRLSKEVADELRAHFGNSVFETVIPRSVRLAEAPSYGLPITAYAPISPGAVAYEQLAVELFDGDSKSAKAKSRRLRTALATADPPMKISVDPRDEPFGGAQDRPLDGAQDEIRHGA